MVINMNFLQGYKTYIVVVLGVVFNGMVAMGYLPHGSLMVVNMVLGFLGLGALRSAVSKNV